MKTATAYIIYDPLLLTFSMLEIGGSTVQRHGRLHVTGNGQFTVVTQGKAGGVTVDAYARLVTADVPTAIDELVGMVAVRQDIP